MTVENDQATFDAAQVSTRIFGDDSKTDFVKRRMASGEWPSRKLGPFRRMTEADIQEVLDLSYKPASKAKPSAAGLSPRTRHRRAS
ncbi:MAG: hypothetical protein WBA98_08205 [Gordonia sp. (in: high G+C Gram-positive bacteria)]|uniref:hypothetical protein n=1 Tax=Gordonia sp. (in: high G+C Gram-positive bacteria) TaxID=84139 RepID=UPI003C7970E5